MLRHQLNMHLFLQRPLDSTPRFLEVLDRIKDLIVTELKMKQRRKSQLTFQKEENFLECASLTGSLPILQ